MDDTSSSRLLEGSRGRTGEAREGPLYNASSQSQTNRILQLAVVGIVIIMVAITVVLSLYRAVTHSGLYFLLGLAILLFVSIELLMVQFIRKGDLPREKTWFLYVVGACIVLEALFTDILLFQ